MARWHRRLGVALLLLAPVALVSGVSVLADDAPPGEAPNLGADRVTQEQIADGQLPRHQIRRAGLIVFTTPFNKLDGYGDGPMDPADSLSPGGRPTLGGNGTLLRVNGLDGQSCLECHSVVSNSTVPATLGIGGVGGSITNAVIMPSEIDPADLHDLDGAADFNGRFANPPFLFGSGAVELLALEMTEDLLALRDQAVAAPGTPVELVSKGVRFGTLVAGPFGDLDTTGVEGVGDDLVVKPFGRKGEFATIRDFAIGAMQFHFGMQPVEAVGEFIDADDDGVVNEVMVGEISALHVFLSTLERPLMEPLGAAARRGSVTFEAIGCASCHVSELNTRGRVLPLRYPSVPTTPRENVYYRVVLTKQPSKFERNRDGGVRVPLFADLKRHDMGDGLAETFALADDRENRTFTTARLWGIADTPPYLHDGRATTLTEAILWHGGEAQDARDQFNESSDRERSDLLEFLRSLRTPRDPVRSPSPAVKEDSGDGNGRRP